MSISIRPIVAITFMLGAVTVLGCEQKVSTPPVKPAATTQAADAYPLDVCVVTGESLGAMGDPVVYEHDGREVRFCCASCIDTFKKDPARYLAKLDAATHDDAAGGHEGHDH
jgi:hypothetical protein